MKTDQPHLALFVKISAWLTGFEEVELQGTGMVSTYYTTLTSNNTHANVEFFFAEVAAIFTRTECEPEATNAAIATGLMPNSCYNNMAKQIILMWYTGQWFADPSSTSTSTSASSSTINAQSYIQALMWPAADTHPPGAKQPGYGSWAKPPVSVSSNAAIQH